MYLSPVLRLHQVRVPPAQQQPTRQVSENIELTVLGAHRRTVAMTAAMDKQSPAMRNDRPQNNLSKQVIAVAKDPAQ
jgi:hypothetical protein